MNTVFTKRQKNADLPARTADWTDEQLLLHYRKTGEDRLFSELVQRYERELYSYLKRYTGDGELAEDIFQATFLQLHLKCDQFTEGRRLKPWLYMIATNKAIDMQRHNRRHQLTSLDQSASAAAGDGSLADWIEGQEPSPISEVSDHERGDWLLARITEMPEHLRVVLHLVYYQGLKYREAADALSIPVGTVKSRLHAAIRELTEAWHDTFGEQDA